MIGPTILNVVQTYRYLGHIISNNLSDEADMEDKMRGLYARSNMLRRKFYVCSDQVKNKLVSAYCNNIYIRYGSYYRKRCMRQFIVSYNNSFRILRSVWIATLYNLAALR